MRKYFYSCFVSYLAGFGAIINATMYFTNNSISTLLLFAIIVNIAIRVDTHGIWKSLGFRQL